MTHRPFLALALCVAACSPAPDAPNAAAPQTAETGAALPAPAPAETGNVAEPTPTSSPAADVLGLEGLGALKIGQPVPAGSDWAERGAQTGESCRTISSPDFPGAYAIVTDSKVQRITIGQRSAVKLAEGIGVGAAERDVQASFPGFREEPHKYEPAPAKYLTAPNAARADGGSALRFEIGADRKVRLIHVGLMPVLGYVEGCS